MRSDGRGHWPRGRRRNEQSEIVWLLDRVAARTGKKRLARWLGIDPRTLRRWLSGEDYPDPARLERAIVASIDRAHPTGTSDYSRRVALWAEPTVPYGGETDRIFHSAGFE